MDDLISRAAVLMSLADYQLQESPNWGANGMGNTDAYEAITECIRVIEQAPTIDPVKHGKWKLDSEGEPHCSLCGKYTNDLQDEPFELNGTVGWALKMPDYCSRCGARMDEELKEEQHEHHPRV